MFDLYDSSVINWNGWWATWQSLREAGWQITVKPAYRDWRLPANLQVSREKVYLRHPETKMLARITQLGAPTNDAENSKAYDYVLDFMTPERNRYAKAPRVFEERDLTVNDIPQLMKLILDLQATVRPKRKPNPVVREQAEILLLKTA